MVPNFSLNWQFYSFEPNLQKKDVSGRKRKKWTLRLNFEYSNWSRDQILAQPDNFDFWIRFAQKEYFQSKPKKVNTTNEFCIFQLVSVPSFSLNWQFCSFEPNLTEKRYFRSKTEKLHFCMRPWSLLNISNFFAREPTDTTTF